MKVHQRREGGRAAQPGVRAAVRPRRFDVYPAAAVCLGPDAWPGTAGAGVYLLRLRDASGRVLSEARGRPVDDRTRAFYIKNHDFTLKMMILC